MKTLKLNLDPVKIGCDFSQEIQWLQEDKITPVDLTSCAAEIDVRTLPTDANVVITLTTNNNYITLVPLEGKIQLSIPKGDTALLAAGTYYYGLVIIDSLGKRIPLTEGTWKFDVFTAREPV